MGLFGNSNDGNDTSTKTGSAGNTIPGALGLAGNGTPKPAGADSMFPTSPNLPKENYPKVDGAVQKMTYNIYDNVADKKGWDPDGVKASLDYHTQPGGKWNPSSQPNMPGVTPQGQTQYAQYQGKIVNGNFLDHHVYGMGMAADSKQPTFGMDPNANLPYQQTYTPKDVPNHLTDMQAVASGYKHAMGDTSWKHQNYASNQPVQPQQNTAITETPTFNRLPIPGSSGMASPLTPTAQDPFINALKTDNYEAMEKHFQTLRRNIDTASDAATYQAATAQMEQSKANLHSVLTNDAMRTGEGYFVMGSQAYGKNNVDQTAQNVIDTLSKTGKFPSSPYPTNPNQPIRTYRDVTQRYDTVLKGMTNETNYTRQQPSKFTKRTGIPDPDNRAGTYFTFLKKFPNSGEWDTQVDKGLPGQSAVRNQDGSYQRDAYGNIKTQDQYGLYKGQVVRAGYLSNYAYGHASAAANLIPEESVKDADIGIAYGAIKFVGQHRSDVGTYLDPQKIQLWGKKFIDNPLDQKAIEQGYREYSQKSPNSY